MNVTLRSLLPMDSLLGYDCESHLDLARPNSSRPSTANGMM